MNRLTYRKLQGLLWGLGMPTPDEQARNLAQVYRASVKAGMTDGQALAVVRLSYTVVRGYTWLVEPDAGAIKYQVQIRNAVLCPNGKDAEDLAAAREGRPSRWGTHDFHREARQ